MSSACTPHRLLGRRVRKKFASCFFVRSMRLEEQDKKGSGREKKMKENEEILVHNSPSHSNRFSGDEDDNYLVFCLGEDGAIDIVNRDDEHENSAAADAAADSQKGDEREENKDEEIEEIKNVEIEEQSLNKVEQFESCDSNLSDASSGSFAFPILKIEEWIGSPVHMPKSENQSARIQCCKF